MYNIYTISIGSIIIYFIAISLCILYPNEGNSDIISYNELLDEDKKTRDSIYSVNVSYIKYGLTDLYKTGEETKYIKDICKSKGCKVREATYYKKIDPSFTNIVRIGTHTKYIVSDLFCVYQMIYNNNIYEYWMLMIWCRRFGYGYMYCEFFVTKAQALDAERNILYKSNNFFKVYKIDDNFSIVLPKETCQTMLFGHAFGPCQKFHH